MGPVEHIDDSPARPREHSGLGALYVAEWPKLVRVAFLLTSSESLAEEIVQDAFVRLQEARTAVKNPGAYLHTSVVNRCRDVHRHRAVVNSTPRQRAGIAEDDHDELFDALGALPWRQHAVLVLRFHLDLSEPDIASILECRPSTVRSLTRRALATLRKALTS